MSDIETQVTPEAGAMLSISRCQGSVNLFASDMDHQHFISLKIAPATTHRSLSRTWYSSTFKPYIEVLLSASQFAEAITSLNIGCGVPCTMHYLGDKKFPRVVPVDERPKFEAEGDRILSDSVAALDASIAMVDTLKISNTSRKEMLAGLNLARRKLVDSLPFLEEQYKEHLDQADQRSKTEIAAYIDHAMVQYGQAGVTKALSSQPEIEIETRYDQALYWAQ